MIYLETIWLLTMYIDNGCPSFLGAKINFYFSCFVPQKKKCAVNKQVNVFASKIKEERSRCVKFERFIASLIHWCANSVVPTLIVKKSSKNFSLGGLLLLWPAKFWYGIFFGLINFVSIRRLRICVFNAQTETK